MKKITTWTDTRRPETEIERMIKALEKGKQNRHSRIIVGDIKVNDLEECEGALQYADGNLYRVYRYKDKLYRQQLTEV